MRRQENLLHAFSGNFTHWENIFCDHFGVDWRIVRDACASLGEWMHHFAGFAKRTCEYCGIFYPVCELEPDLGKSEPPQKQRKTKHHRLEDLPESHVDDSLDQPALSWDSPVNHFVIVSDCRPLVHVTNGYSPLSSSSLLPLFHRITNNLVSLFDNGLLPNRAHLDPVIWRRREFNKKADHLVNYTMDVRRSWHQLCPVPFPDLILSDSNFIIHFDGGSRGNDCSASAWILEARAYYKNSLVEFPVIMCGKFMCPAVSSFMAEALALESCTEIFAKLISKLSILEPAHKRSRLA